MMKNFILFLNEAMQPSFPEDDFVEYDNVVYLPDEYIPFVKKWLYSLVIKETDYFIIEAINDIIRGMDERLTYKTGINFIIDKTTYSVYSFSGQVTFSSSTKITLNKIKTIIGAE